MASWSEALDQFPLKKVVRQSSQAFLQLTIHIDDSHLHVGQLVWVDMFLEYLLMKKDQYIVQFVQHVVILLFICCIVKVFIKLPCVFRDCTIRG